jgi:hypothetical protein
MGAFMRTKPKIHDRAQAAEILDVSRVRAREPTQEGRIFRLRQPRQTGTDMSNFLSLLRRADTLRREELDAIRAAWWVWYMRGIRRAHHENFGTDAKHNECLDFANSDDAMRAAQDRG